MLQRKVRVARATRHRDAAVGCTAGLFGLPRERNLSVGRHLRDGRVEELQVGHRAGHPRRIGERQLGHRVGQLHQVERAADEPVECRRPVVGGVGRSRPFTHPEPDAHTLRLPLLQRLDGPVAHRDLRLHATPQIDLDRVCACTLRTLHNIRCQVLHIVHVRPSIRQLSWHQFLLSECQRQPAQTGHLCRRSSARRSA